MKKVITVIVILASVFKANAQQDIMVSQYMFNGLFLNPAYAGSHKYFSSSLTYRKQWVNFDGAPTTYLFAVDGPLMKQKMGLGLILANDKIGVTTQNDIYANYSYFLKMGEGKLGFGLKGGVSQMSAKVSDLIVVDANDPVYGGAVKKTGMIPKFGFGSYYYTNNWFAGFSIPELFAGDQQKDFAATVNTTTTIRNHFYLTGGYVHKVNNMWSLKPTFLVKKEKASPTQLDVNLTVFYMDKIALGVTYRTKDAITAMLIAQITKQFRVGYAYDITTTEIKRYSAGSHEIMLGYAFGKDVIKTITPRYF